MKQAKLARLRRELESLRKTQPKAEALERLASSLGRKKASRRGKEPTYVSAEFPHLTPLSIPSHKGRDIPTGTRNSILNQLEYDLVAWEDRLARQGGL